MLCAIDCLIIIGCLIILSVILRSWRSIRLMCRLGLLFCLLCNNNRPRRLRRKERLNLRISKKRYSRLKRRKVRVGLTSLHQLAGREKRKIVEVSLHMKMDPVDPKLGLNNHLQIDPCRLRRISTIHLHLQSPTRKSLINLTVR